MRDNGYISQREFSLEDGDTLLSTTDLKGRIVYANDSFIRCSGFDREELYGKAHNLVRHPDMPESAFADMWKTIQSGKPWSALVKNRRKDGDHYWVRANASPIRRLGEVVGYLSVRTKPDRPAVEQHEALYQRLRKGDTSSEQVEAGARSVTGAGDAMAEAVGAVESLAAMMETIRLASREQATGVAQINAALSRIEQTTQDNAAQVRNNVELSYSLSEQAQRLDEAASVFRQEAP